MYLWDLDEGGFAGVVLLKKEVKGEEAGWDSVHVFEVDEQSSRRTSHYKLTSTVILHLARSPSASKDDSMTLAGSMTRQTEADLVVENIGNQGKDGGHIVNFGKLVEDMEGRMRNILQEVYFGKAKDVVGDLRSTQPLSGVNRDRQTQREVMGAMSQR